MLSLDLLELAKHTPKIKDCNRLINFLENLKIEYNLNNYFDLAQNPINKKYDKFIIKEEAVNHSDHLLKDLNYLCVQLGLPYIKNNYYYENLKYTDSPFYYMDDAISFYERSIFPFDPKIHYLKGIYSTSNFVIKPLLKNLNITANEDLFSMMFNYIIRNKGLSNEEFVLLRGEWHILEKRCQDDETKEKKLKVLQYIKNIYIREIPFIDVSDFLLSLDRFEGEKYTTKIKNRNMLISFLEYLKKKYNLNNFIDLLANRDIVSKEAINYGGNYLLKSLNYLFASFPFEEEAEKEYEDCYRLTKKIN